MSGFYPDLSYRYRHPSRTSPTQPQNLMRPTWKGVDGLRGVGCAACDRASGMGAIGETVKVLMGLRGFGDAEVPTVVPDVVTDTTAPTATTVPRNVFRAYALMSTAGAVSGAYHGYKRNDSLGWAVAWFFLGGWFPLITIPVSIAQGYGKRESGLGGTPRGIRGAKRRKR